MRTPPPWAFLLFLLIPASLPVSLALLAPDGDPGRASAAAWLPPLFVFGLLPLLEVAVGANPAGPRDEAERRRLARRPDYLWVVMLAVPVQLGLLAWSTWQFTQLALTPLGRIGWILSQGVIGGVVAINAAHELIHKPGRLAPWLGGLLLASVNNAAFKIEHLRGHHVNVATPRDGASARRGQTVYGFVPAALIRNTLGAWRLEARRLRAAGHPLLSPANEMLRWSACTLVFATACATIGGWFAVVFFLAQGLVASAALEVVNYIEHYGLRRREIGPGRYERTTILHSWNSSHVVSNLMLFQLQRHSDHHAHAARPYQALAHHAESPQLPAGYAAMFVAALIPPLWFALVHPRLDRLPA